MIGISTLHFAEDRLTVSQHSVEEGFRIGSSGPQDMTRRRQRRGIVVLC
jgi:hypothetical protein